jgi:hypothetical protein
MNRNEIEIPFVESPDDLPDDFGGGFKDDWADLQAENASLRSQVDEIEKIPFAQIFRDAAKRFCGDEKVSLENARHVLTVANMAQMKIHEALKASKTSTTGESEPLNQEVDHPES